MLLLKLDGFERFIVDFIKGRDAIVPFEQGSRVADAFHRVTVHLPNGIQDGVVVCVENVLLKLLMAGDMDLAHAMVRNVA